jgi:hypothetical protein
MEAGSDCGWVLITYSFHAGAAMQEVAEYLVAIGQPTPNPLLSVAWLARDEEGKIKGVLCIQSLPLCEPCEGESSEIVRELFSRAEAWIRECSPPRVLMHSGHPAMKAMLRRKGAVESSDQWFEWTHQ